ncbi:MAG: helicase-related protein [Chloroflexi bacterium]|nr:helicase-related protein [Chloroflexota bacterium]
MKEENKAACVAATVTLELGIDLGRLDQVLQINSTHSVASFVQRLGRSGRRESPPRICAYTIEDQSEAAYFGEEFPWNLLQMLPIIQLNAEEKWIEPPRIPRLPFS